MSVNLKATRPNYGEIIGRTTGGEDLTFLPPIDNFFDDVITSIDDINAAQNVGVGAILASNEAITAATAETLTNWTEEFDLGGDFASGVFTAPIAGKYRIHGYVAFANAADQDRLRVIIRKDGTEDTTLFFPSSGTAATTCPYTKTYNLELNDTLELRVENVDSNDTVIATDRQTALYIEYLDKSVAPTETAEGTVTSVAISGTDGLEVDAGSPITTSGTITMGVNAAALRTHINVEDGADVTDATNVNAAGATMNTDTNVSANSWVLDEDNMASNDNTKVPTQQSTKAYVDTRAPSHTAGSVLFSDGTNIAQDNSNFFWDDTNNRLGVGTAAPERDFHVFAGSAGTDPAWTTGTDKVLFENSGNLGVHLFTPAANVGFIGFSSPTSRNRATLQYSHSTDTMAMRIGATNNQFVLDTTGLGLNQTSPATRLHVDGAITQNPLSSDPSDPAIGNSIMWVSDGTGSGDAGDIMMKINVGGTTKTITLVDYSAA